MNRTEKQSLIDELHKDFQGSPHAILVDYRGLSVPAATEFRRRLPFPVALDRFLALMIAPYRAAFRTFHPLLSGGLDSGH